MNRQPLLGALALLLLGWYQPALAATEVSGSIEGNTTWSVAESPFIVTDPIYFSSIEPGATLTIDPGVIVEFTNGSSLNIFGNIRVNGTAESPVSFTSLSGTDWEVNLFDSVESQINNLNITNSDQGIFVFNSKISIDGLRSTVGGGLFGDGSDVTVQNLELEKGNAMFFSSQAWLSNVAMNGGAFLSDGGQINLSNHTQNGGFIGLYNTNSTLQNISITNANAPAISIDNSVASINQLTVTNAPVGLDIYNSSTLTLNGASVSNITGGPAFNLIDSTGYLMDAMFDNGNNLGVNVGGSSTLEISNVSVTNFANVGVVNGGNLNGMKVELINNLLGITNTGSTVLQESKIRDNAIIGATHSGEGTFSIANSLIAGNGIAGVDSSGVNPLEASLNYWGDPSGPLQDPLNPEGLGNPILGNAIFEPWLSAYCEVDCHSNIMFLPGIMSSRLYKNDSQLWEPGILTQDEDFESLYLDQTGASIDPTIYTKDVLDNGYAYGQFVEDLNELKSIGTINDYEAVPYDWRLSMEDVLNNGVKDDGGAILYDSPSSEPYTEKTLRRLAADSKSGKVTIVAHSNGGLVTKALINKLGDESVNLIDKVIFVGVPQIGTPQAIGALLHGYDAGLPDIYPFILSAERSRDLAINMPMIYQLMPFHDYYEGQGAEVHTPYITFEDGVATQAFIDQYGYAVTPDELEGFLNGIDGRTSAAYGDLAHPINTNAALLAEALSMQSEIDSTWQAPTGIKVHQIAGIGEETLAGIKYKTIQKCALSVAGLCHERVSTLSYEPITVLDGDGTVVVPSALAMSDVDAERWWINLQTYNGVTPIFFREQHADILEIDEIRTLIFKKLMKRELTDLPNFISNVSPSIESDRNLSFTLHSPLKLSAVDEDGNKINEKEATIPGATYQRYGEVQRLTMPSDVEFTIVLEGEAEGSFVLEMAETDDGEIMATSTFAAIPSSTSTIATINFAGNSLRDASALEVDYNGDTITDFTYTLEINEVIVTPDATLNIGSSGGRSSKAKGQVLGTSTDISETIKQLQSLIAVLHNLRGKIPEGQYVAIENRLKEILSTLLLSFPSNKGL